MHLTELHADGFRSLRAIHFNPIAGLNVIYGDNAQGKTSLLEALLYLVTSKSHRTNVDSELVRHGEPGFRLKGLIQRADRTVTLEAAWWERSKRIKVNGVALTKASEVLGKVHVVFFSPEDVGIVRGAATERRTFMDMELAQLAPSYLHALQQFRQVLRQRNELLRAHRVDTDLLASWDAQFAQWAAILIRDRRHFIAALDARTQETYALIAGGERLGLRYVPNIRPDEDPLQTLERGRETDIRRGMTMRGPHRDDLEFTVEGEAARAFASQGQQRTAALALKLADAVLVHSRTGEYPILMLDDVLSELDASRSRRLFRALAPGMQCLLTTTDLVENRELFGAKAAHFRIKDGRLVSG